MTEPADKPDQIFATIDPDGRLTGFYHSAINPVIPETAIAISPEQHQAWLTAQARKIWKNGALTDAPTPPAREPTPISKESLQAALVAVQQQTKLIEQQLARLQL